MSRTCCSCSTSSKFLLQLFNIPFPVPGPELAPAVQHPPSGLLRHLTRPQWQRALLRLPTRGAVRLLPSSGHGRHCPLLQLDIRLSCVHGRWVRRRHLTSLDPLKNNQGTMGKALEIDWTPFVGKVGVETVRKYYPLTRGPCHLASSSVADEINTLDVYTGYVTEAARISFICRGKWDPVDNIRLPSCNPIN